MKNVKLIMLMTLLCLTWSFVGFAQQGGIDQKYNFSGSFNRLRGTQSCLFTANQKGTTVSGRINFSDPRVQGNYTGTITNGVVHATITWVSAPDDLKKATFLRLQKFTGRDFPELSLFDNASYKTNNRVRPKIVYALEKKVFGNANPPKTAVSKVKPNQMAGFYVVRGLDDPKGIKRDIYFEIKQYPNQEFKHDIEAKVIGEDYGITGDPHKRLFVGDVEGNNVTIMIHNLYEKGKKLVNAMGSIVGNGNSLYIKSPTVGYKLERTTKVIAERESNKLSPTVKVRVEYKFIYLPSSLKWDTGVLNVYHSIGKTLPIALYGTGNIKAQRETSSTTVNLKNMDNLPERVFDIPKSRAANKHLTYYFDKRKNLSWGGTSMPNGFYRFAKDAEMKESHSDYSSPAIFPVEKYREFEVSRAALEGKDERVAIIVNYNLSNKLGSGDINFGNKQRKVYLHELGDISKLNIEEKYRNDIYDSNHNRIGVSNDSPIYYFVPNLRGPIVAFTIEIIE